MLLATAQSEGSFEVFAWFSSLFGEFCNAVILILLALDSIRWIISALGFVDPKAKYAWLIYGKYDRQLLHAALQDLGFSDAKQAHIADRMGKLAEEVTHNEVSKEDAAIQLIVLLAKYIVKLPVNSKYGIKSPMKSEYYVDTMEASHHEEDLSKMVSLMKCLLESSNVSPDIIITPKGGNVLLAKDVAYLYSSFFLMAKDATDSSKVTSLDQRLEFMINYEGSFDIVDSNNSNCSIVLDCNTSGGSQLLNIVKDIAKRRSTKPSPIGVPSPSKAFVLFRVDDSKRKLDEEFSKNGCALIRFFDLDEETKELLYELNKSCVGEAPDYYYPDDKKCAEEILANLDKKGKLFYKNGVLINESTVGSC